MCKDGGSSWGTHQTGTNPWGWEGHGPYPWHCYEGSCNGPPQSQVPTMLACMLGQDARTVPTACLICSHDQASGPAQPAPEASPQTAASQPEASLGLCGWMRPGAG